MGMWIRRLRFSSWLAVGLAVAMTAGVFAAELQTDVLLSANPAAPTNVGIGNNSFQIRVWATGSLPSNTNNTGVASIVDRYTMATTGTISPDNTSATTLNFQTGYNYTTDCSSSPIQGCASNPFIVNATLAVAAGTANGTAGTLTVALTGSNGLSADATPDLGYVQVVVATCEWGSILPPVNAVGAPDAEELSVWKAGTRGVIPAKFQLSCGSNLIDTQTEAASHPATLSLIKLSNGIGSDSPVTESLETGSANAGNAFRFDDSGDLYIYNIGVKSLSAGTYKLIITDTASGANRSEYFGLN